MPSQPARDPTRTRPTRQRRPAPVAPSPFPARPTLIALALGLAACKPEPRPWDGPIDGGVVDESTPWLPRPADASWLGDAALASSDDDGGLARPVAVGGLWVSCYGGFHPSDDPLRDVTRLGLLCGPPNGMKLRTEPTAQGTIDAADRPAHFTFTAARGECLRIFAVAARSIADLDVTVRSSRGSQLTTDHSEDRWPILDPERPFCTFADDTFTVELRAREGSGRWAAQVWALPAG